MTSGDGRARRPHRRREHRRTRSRGHERRLRRPAERRRRRPARLVLHARPEEARRRRRGARRRAHAVARGEGGHGARPTITCWSARAPRRSRGTWASRSRPTSTPPRSRELWLEWKRRIDPDALPRPAQARRRRASPPACRWSREGLIDRDHFYGTINCDGVSPKGEIAGVTTTSGLAWKIPGRVGDSPHARRGAVRRRRRRRRRFDGPGRSQPLRPLLVPHRREHAARHAAEGRGHGGPAPHQGEHHREAAPQQPRASRTSTSTSTC